LIPSVSTLKSCLDMMVFSLENIIVTEDIVSDDKYKYIFSVEAVNALVQAGTPFRDAYKIVGQEIAEGKFEPNKEVKHTHVGSVGNLALDQIQEKMNAAF